MTKQVKQLTLKQSQYHLLMLLYKFQYISIPLLTTYKKLKSNSLQRNLNILVDQNYIAKQYSAKDKLDRKPAIYYLGKKGIATLRSDPRLDTQQLNTYYKNEILTDDYKQRCIDTFAVFNNINAGYADMFDIFTRQEIAHFESLPATKPDLYLRGEPHYFLILAHNLQPFLARKQLNEYIAHFDEEGWSDGDDYPNILFVLSSETRKQAFLTYADNALERAGIGYDELPIGATTVDKIITAPRTTAIWSFAGDPQALRALDG